MIKQTINIYSDNNREINALDSVVNNVNGSFFTGVEDQINLYLDPIVTGYAFIYWVDLPSWFNDDPDLKYFKAMTEKNFRNFAGISAIDLQTGSLTTGFAGNDISFATGIQRNNTDFSIQHKEYSGSPMRKMYQKWVSMIRDPRTGLAVYPKLYNVEYGARNHSGQLLYIMTRPDATNVSRNVVEYAAFYSNVIPTNIPLDTLYNFDLGTQDSPTIDIQFKGFPEIGPNVDAFASRILREKIMTRSSDSADASYIPFVDSYNSGTIGLSTSDPLSSQGIGGTSIFKEIYEDTESVDEG